MSFLTKCELLRGKCLPIYFVGLKPLVQKFKQDHFDGFWEKLLQ